MGKRSSFSKIGESPKRCGSHKIEGDINVRSEKCEYRGCVKQPNFCQPGENPKRCASHKIEGDTAKRRKCEYQGCVKQPNFSQTGEIPKRCGSHKIDGDIGPTSKECEFPACRKRRVFSQPGESPKRCGSHKINGDVDVYKKKCEFPNCTTTPSFSQPGEISKRCGYHKINGDVNISNRKCHDCGKQAVFGKRGGKKERCGSHRIEGDIDISTKRCSICTWNDIYDRSYASYINPETGILEMCYKCHLAKYPNQHTRITVSKEQFILAEIQRQIPELEPYFLTWDCALPNQDCTKKRPDMVWKVKDTLIHLEIDEKGERHEDSTERIVAIHAASNLLNHKLIRFNPDKSLDGSESCLKRTILRGGDLAFKPYIPEWEKRIPVFVQEVRNALEDSLKNVNVITGKKKLFF